MYRIWTDEEIEYLNKNYYIKSSEELSKHLDRSIRSIIVKANRLGIENREPTKKYWTKEEEEYLSKYWGRRELSVLSKKLNRSRASVYLKGKREYGEIRNQGYSCSELARAINVNATTVQHYKRIGLKTKKFKRYVFVEINDFWKFAKEHKKTVKFYRFERNSIPNEPKWVEEERKKQFAELRDNQGKEWTNYEDIILTNLVKRGKTNGEIAREMKRSINSIHTRKSILNINYMIEMERNNAIQV